MNICLILNCYGDRAFWIYRHKIIVNTNKERSCVLLIFMFKEQICYNETNKFVTAHNICSKNSSVDLKALRNSSVEIACFFVEFSNIYIERQKFYDFCVTNLSFQQ
jgi:hypothetical protein